MYSFSYIIHKTSSVINNRNNFYSNFSQKSHYDVLNLPRNCTARDIKQSFIKLSKENHPDINKNKDAHTKFLAINESYKILSNTLSRRNYDLGLIPTRCEAHHAGATIYNKKSKNNHFTDSSFYSNRDRSKDELYANKSYYGVKGQVKVSNIKIVVLCLTVTSIIIALQVLAIRKSLTLQRDELLKRSKDAENSLSGIKKRAELNGNQIQMEILKKKLVDHEKFSKGS